MIGRCLIGSDGPPSYTPCWRDVRRWVYQAQYFWFDERGAPHAMCGEVFETRPGALLRSTVAYSSASGSISASISEVGGAARIASIEIARPLLHARHYATWADFFAAAARASRTRGALARPQLPVSGLCAESHGPRRRWVPQSAPCPADTPPQTPVRILERALFRP